MKAWDTTDPARPRAQGEGSGYSIPTGYYHSIAFRPDGAYVAAAAAEDRAVHTYELRRDRSGPELSGSVPSRRESAVRRLPTGRPGLGLGRRDRAHHPAGTPPPRSVPGRILEPGDSPGDAFDPAAHYVVTTADFVNGKGPVRIWDVGGVERVPKQVARLPEPWDKALFVGHGRFLISQDAKRTRLRLWHVDDGRLRPGHEFALPGGAKEDENPVVVSVNDDGTLLALRGPSEKTIGIWDVRDIDRPERVGQVPWPENNGRNVPGFVGPSVLVLMTPEATQLWDARDARRPRLADTVKVRSKVAFGADGRYFLVGDAKEATGAEPQKMPVWALADDGSAHPAAPIPMSEKILTAPVLTSGRTMAALSEDGRPLLWDLRKPQQHGVPLPGPVSKMQYLKASTDHRLLVAHNSEKALAVWRVSDPDGAQPGGDDRLLVLSDGTQEVKVKEVSPSGDLLMETTGGNPLRALGIGSLVVSADFDRLGRTLCSIRRTPVPDKQWKELLPGVEHRDACA
ncbi:hypothetical protein GCM10020000_02680 [Streptomyces olivoverticillatus]